MASLERQNYITSTLLFVSVQEDNHSVCKGATDHQEVPAVPIVQVHPCCIPWGEPGQLVPRPRARWGKAELPPSFAHLEGVVWA